MNYRKYVLPGILGVMAAVYAGDWLLNHTLKGALQSRRALTTRLEQSIAEKKRQWALVRRGCEELTGWCSQSLPSHAEVARSLYQAWLLELVVHVDLAGPNVNPGELPNRDGPHRVLSFQVQGRGTLEQLTKFLFEFYRADHLHQIRSLTVTPLPNTDELSLSISIEAMVLADAADAHGQRRPDRLSDAHSDRLASDRLDYYRVIVDRDLFGTGGAPDAVRYTVLTRVTYVDDRPEATFTLQTTDERTVLTEGQPLEIGSFRATVREIEGADVIIESNGQRWLLTIGDSLTDAFALPPEF